MADRTALLSLLAQLDQADAATQAIIASDAGDEVDESAEVVALLIDSMSTAVTRLLRSSVVSTDRP